MPSSHELIVFLVAIVAIWFVLKMARLAIKLILFVIALACVAGGIWLFLAR